MTAAFRRSAAALTAILPAALTAALTTVLTAVLLCLLAAAPAGAASSYRYWSFWQQSSGSWSYQQQGAAVHIPADGSVDGWRFTLSTDGGKDTERPRSAPDFAASCANTPAQRGKKRVAVLLDFGTPADSSSAATPPAARSACAVLDPTASSADALAAVAPPLRYDTSGLICAIAGYPSAGCGEVAAAPAPAKPAGNGPNLGLLAGGALVLLLGAGAWWQARRR
ncbi:hypothetical protein P3T36_004809 [Kitasatospora sp. MAP12-15]|uniref:SCO2322 family protein n=1 Tax=unclassified Kitasatospora TaxID=2633591 RepID=UPI0024753BD6|nr:SCO2322 family protein [Kitasatospora sp. MAP12-44]MDH6110259.1 hypothetical protein [Kitasatospora sp. MAP12-44]